MLLWGVAHVLKNKMCGAARNRTGARTHPKIQTQDLNGGDTSLFQLSYGTRNHFTLIGLGLVLDAWGNVHFEQAEEPPLWVSRVTQGRKFVGSEGCLELLSLAHFAV